MAEFYGTAEEFNTYVGPWLRNRVQSMTRKPKQETKNVCQHCGKKVFALQAAHVHGRERKQIIAEVLSRYAVGGGRYRIGDLGVFTQEFEDAHKPLGKTFLFLCADCHHAYDSSYADLSPRAFASSDVPISEHDVKLPVEVASEPVQQPFGGSLKELGETVDNATFAKRLASYIKDNLEDPEGVARCLSNPAFCSSIKMHCGKMAVLKQLATSIATKNETHISGKRRYYDHVTKIGDGYYVVTNHWYQGPDGNKALLVSWLRDCCKEK